MQAKDRILVALDVPSIDEALNVIETLAPHVGGFKVGPRLCIAAGAPDVVRTVRVGGGRVMLDLNLHDIPPTMAKAVRAAAKLGADFLTIHESTGPKGIVEAVANCGETKILGVTVLTSHADMKYKQIFGHSAVEGVLQFARWLAELGAAGIVCLPEELKLLHAERTFDRLLKVIPGIRPDWAATGDQQCVMTPGEAIRAGADYLVIGRPILKPPTGMTPIEAAQRIAEEIDAARRGVVHERRTQGGDP
ncbi:MAG: orotidine-5'-phosphate decarboxylase [bacterium]|nr:orotidine-5'-phosphate decarboxylase [bacterium]